MKIKKWAGWEMSNLGSFFYAFHTQLSGTRRYLLEFRNLRLRYSPCVSGQNIQFGVRFFFKKYFKKKLLNTQFICVILGELPKS